MIESSGLMLPLFMVSGACHGMEISLETNSMPFGAVVMKSSYTRRLIMNNTGDIGAKFVWFNILIDSYSYYILVTWVY